MEKGETRRLPHFHLSLVLAFAGRCTNAKRVTPGEFTNFNENAEAIMLIVSTEKSSSAHRDADDESYGFTASGDFAAAG